jgi:hypothetical protein
MAPSTRVRVGDCFRISYKEVVDRFHNVICHPYELVVCERQMHTLRHKVIDGPRSVAQTERY